MNSKSQFNRFNDWCNSHQGLLAFVAILITVVGVIPFNKIDFAGALTFLDTILAILSYQVRIPLMVLLAIIILFIFYFLRTKRRYSPSPRIMLSDLKGKWRNDWSGTKPGHEIFELKENGEYILNGVHIFTLTDFKYHRQNHTITFVKTAVRDGDNRTAQNELKVINNELLEGNEEGYNIKYSKISQ